MRICKLPANERPVQRLITLGPAALSDAELLALISGQQDLARCQASFCASDGWGGVLRDDIHTLANRLGTARRAAAVKAALEIGRRLLIGGVDTRLQIRSPADVASLLLLEMGHLEQEHLRTVLLDTKNRVQQIATIYIGSVNSAQVRIGEVFRDAIRRNSAALIVAHNHPSGDPTPSPEDILVTRQIVEAGKLLDIDVLDHLILSHSRYVSLRERGLGFPS
jgi:DNA repair protein RadC